jgi:hypothetical protein
VTRSLACALFVCVSTLAVATSRGVAQSRSAPEIDAPFRTMTPAKWSQVAAHVPRCESATQPSRDDALVVEAWHVDSLDGTIALPRNFSPRPTKRGNRWIAPDSSSISIDGTWALGGMAMSGGKIVGGMGTCAAQLFGRKVPAQEFAVLVSTKGDTIFFSMPSTFVTTGQGMQITIQAHSAERRARLLEYAESLQLGKATDAH